MRHEADQCWGLKRVSNGMEEPSFLLQNNKNVITCGKRSNSNDKVCDGPNVSRHHLKFIRIGSSLDWQSARWSVRAFRF